MDSQASENWNLSDRLGEDEIHVVHVNEKIRNLMGSPDYAFVVEVVVYYKKKPRSGRPDEAEVAQLKYIEIRIQDLVESGHRGILAITCKTKISMELIFYVKDPDKILEKVNQLQADVMPHEISAVKHPDPTWRLYRSYTEFGEK